MSPLAKARPWKRIWVFLGNSRESSGRKKSSWLRLTSDQRGSIEDWLAGSQRAHLQAELGQRGAHQDEQSAVVQGTATLLERGLHLRSQVLELREGQRESEQGGHAQGGQLGGHSACSLEGERQDLSEE